MKTVEDYYEEYTGDHHLFNSCKNVHDSAEMCAFAEYYNERKAIDEKENNLNL